LNVIYCFSIIVYRLILSYYWMLYGVIYLSTFWNYILFLSELNYLLQSTRLNSLLIVAMFILLKL